MQSSFCYIHMEAEEVPERLYVVCFECGHVYATAQDLVDAFNREADRMNANPILAPYETEYELVLHKTVEDVETINFCQECIHDF